MSSETGNEVSPEPSAQEHEHLRLLLEINNAVVSALDPQELFRAISLALSRIVQHDYSSLILYEPRLCHFRLYAIDFPEGKGLLHQEVVFQVENSPAGEAYTSRQPVVVDELHRQNFPAKVTSWLIEEGIKSACWLPLLRGERCLGALCIARQSLSHWEPKQIRLLSEVANQIAIAVENALAYREIKELRDKLARERTYLESEISTYYDEDQMIGRCPAWQEVLRQIATVAPTDATVLILGETGTGKELVARSIHRQSSRAKSSFIKLNCSAVPGGLLESELFGHRKGAFTGAVTDQIGRFELANQGTLMLDEIGDMPLDLQPKLLRVLQEQQFERLGSPQTIRVDIRLVAITNRDLPEMVRQRQFRDDLYYRLNVFPIYVPPLRQRRADIPLLVHHFMRKYGSRMRRQMHAVDPASMKQLVRADWPGNIRELENVIERAVILSRDGVLRVSLERRPVLRREVAPMNDAERDHILSALRSCGGRIAGANGAAALLGMKRTTLNSRMRKLGISRTTALHPAPL